MAMREQGCYSAMGDLPSGIAAVGRRRPLESVLRGILSASVHAPVRVSAREEAGAAGAAMMAAVAIGAYPDMDSCVAEWVTPLLSPAESPDPALVALYDRLFEAYAAARRGLVPTWDLLASARRQATARRRAMAEEQDMITETGMIDLFVIGGGINGAGVARDAAGRGLSVVLCEKDDLAEGTSSRSGKLVHGGLRYLEYYEFRLVREALIEREVLLKAAPHIIWPMRFVLPHTARTTDPPGSSAAPACSCTTISAAASACRARPCISST